VPRARLAYLAGAVRTCFGGYGPAFLGAGALCIMAAFGVLPIARRREVFASASA
jgi:hypothetical protein